MRSLLFAALLALMPVAGRASMVDFATCVKEAGTNSYIYGRVDPFGRVGPYDLTVKDLFAIGVCTGEGRLYGVVNDWSLCDFKGSLAQANATSSVDAISASSEVQDLYFSVIASGIHEREVVDLFNLKGLTKYRSYPQWEQTLTGIAYRKGTKALRYHALFKANVLDNKGDRQSLVEQLDKMQKCSFLKNNVQRQEGASTDWLKHKPVARGEKIQKFTYAFPDPETTAKLLALVEVDPEVNMFSGAFSGKNPPYMYSKIDYDGNNIADYVVLLLSEKYQYNNMPYFIVFHDEGKKIDSFPANTVGHAGNKLVVNGLEIND